MHEPPVLHINKIINNWNMCYLCGFAVKVKDSHTSMTCPANWRKPTHVEGFSGAHMQSYIGTGYNACSKGMHKNVLPTNASFWQGGAVNDKIANKCKSLVSANVSLLDPTKNVSATQACDNYKITVTTSNCLTCTASPSITLAIISQQWSVHYGAHQHRNT